MRSVHNLEELTQRPFTLRLVAEFIPDIEKDRLAGRPVYGVTLYRRMATFLARIDEGSNSAFQFSHSSLLEFFLADYLLAGRG